MTAIGKRRGFCNGPSFPEPDRILAWVEDSIQLSFKLNRVKERLKDYGQCQVGNLRAVVERPLFAQQVLGQNEPALSVRNRVSLQRADIDIAPYPVRSVVEHDLEIKPAGALDGHIDLQGIGGWQDLIFQEIWLPASRSNRCGVYLDNRHACIIGELQTRFERRCRRSGGTPHRAQD
jgi:hypothetical protein